MCEFTGTNTTSNAHPGRCTKTPGYIRYAEIIELIANKREAGLRTLHDGGSNKDVLLYDGDYVSYMTPSTKETRREDWKGLNFAGSVDWALDLQSFGSADMEDIGRPQSGNGCRYGDDDTANTGNLCIFSCRLGFCPESLCACLEQGPFRPLPAEVPGMAGARAWDPVDVDLNRLCKFGCKYGNCPADVCATQPEEEDDDEVDDAYQIGWRNDTRNENNAHCYIYKDWGETAGLIPTLPAPLRATATALRP